VNRVNLCRLWYIFPPDDKELKPGEFRCKVMSYVGALPTEEKRAVLELLIVQYAAFQRQLEIMRAGAVLTPDAPMMRAWNLSHHLRSLRRCRRSIQPDCTYLV
jgi:hypothetical protein